MIRVISSFADGPVNFHSTGPAEDQIQKLISSTVSNTRRASVSSDIQTCRSDITNTRRSVSSDIQTLRSNTSNNNQSTINNQSDIQTLRSAMAKMGSNRIF